MVDNLEKKIKGLIKELKDKKKKEKEKEKKRIKEDLEKTNKEIDFFKKNFSQYEKRLKNLTKLLSKNKDIIWKLTFDYQYARFHVDFSPYNPSNNPYIGLTIEVVMDRNHEKIDKYIKVTTYENWSKNSPFIPEKFTKFFSKDDDLFEQNVWSSFFAEHDGFRSKYKRFNLDEPKNAFDHFVDQIINIAKINYVNQN